MAATDEALEDATNDDPAGELHAARWWEEHGGAECGGNVNVTPPRVRVTAGKNVEWDGEEGADEDDVEEAMVPA